MEAVDQVVNYSFKGGEMTIRLLGSGAKNMILLLAALLKDANRTKGQVRLSRLLKEGKEQTVFAIKRDDLKAFHAHALKYGVLYSAINNPNTQTLDIIVKAEDIPKIKRIFEKLGLGEISIEGQIIPENIIQEQSQERAAPDSQDNPNVIYAQAPKATEADIALDAINKERDEIIEHKGTITYCDELIQEAKENKNQFTNDNILQFEQQRDKASSKLRDTYSLGSEEVEAHLDELDKKCEPLEKQKAAEQSSKGTQQGKNPQTRKSASRSGSGLRESNVPQADRLNTTERFSIKDALNSIAERQAAQQASAKQRARSREPKMTRGDR